MKMLTMNEFEIVTIRPRLLYFTRCNIKYHSTITFYFEKFKNYALIEI